MPRLTISDVAKQVGLKPSAIRYYERVGLLPTAQRASGQRRYDATVLYRLAVIQRAKRLRFSLEEIRRLFTRSDPCSPAAERWNALSRHKLGELENLMEELVVMQHQLKGMISNCHCATFEQCGKAIFEKELGRPPLAPKYLYGDR